MLTVEVLLPIKAPAPWLEETLRSLKEQTFKDWGLIAAIHGANEEIRAKVIEYFPHSIVVNARAEGNLASTLNAGLRVATAPFIARIDQDDIAEPKRLAIQAKFLEDHSRVLCVGTSASLIGSQGQFLGHRSQPDTFDEIYRKLRWKCPLMHPSVMFRRIPVETIGGYSEIATNVEDYDLWLRLAALGPLVGIKEPLTRYRIHAEQITSYRTIPPLAVAQIGNSRILLAKAHGQSVLAARCRQFIWKARQGVRRIQRRKRT